MRNKYDTRSLKAPAHYTTYKIEINKKSGSETKKKTLSSEPKNESLIHYIGLRYNETQRTMTNAQ